MKFTASGQKFGRRHSLARVARSTLGWAGMVAVMTAANLAVFYGLLVSDPFLTNSDIGSILNMV
jgi:hypothetical protein